MTNIQKVPKTHRLHKTRTFFKVLVFLVIFMLLVTSACLAPEAPPEPEVVESAHVSARASAPIPTPAPEPEPAPTPEPKPEIVVVHAFRSDTNVFVDEVPINLCLFNINGQYFLNLFEFALILADFDKKFFPEWVYKNNVINVSSESSYTVEELTFSHRNPDITPATEIDVTVFLDGSEIFTPAYLIEDDVFFEFDIISGAFDLIVDNDFEGGVIEIFTNQALADRAARIKSIDPSLPMIALTFDDGPGTTTIEILDILEQHNVVATFYVLGSLVERHGEIVLRAHDMGCEIANHTWSHMSAEGASADSLRSQLQRTRNEIESVTGIPSTNFRPPFGSITGTLQSVTGELGYPIILWSIDPSDYLPISPTRIYDHIMGRVQDKDIILLHDIHNRTLEATKRLVPSLIEQGFQFVTVSELLHFSGITPNPGGIYRHGR